MLPNLEKTKVLETDFHSSLHVGNGTNKPLSPYNSGLIKQKGNGPPNIVYPVEDLLDKRVVQIAAHGDLSVCLTDQGACISCSRLVLMKLIYNMQCPGEVWYWGNGHFVPRLHKELHGQGRGDKSRRVTKIYCGGRNLIYAQIDENETSAYPQVQIPDSIWIERQRKLDNISTIRCTRNR